MASSDQFPIIIMGAGPVGLTLALGLLRQGFAVLVFEQRPALAIDPRATTIQPPTMEMLRDLGVLEAVEERSRKVDNLQYWDWSSKQPELLADVPLAHLESQTSLPYRLNCAQPHLCEELRDAVEALLPGTINFGTKVTEFTDRGDCVDVEITENGRTRTVRGSWLCACDGANSHTRHVLGLPMRKLTRTDVFFTCEMELDVDEVFQKHFGVVPGDASWLFTRKGWAMFMRMPASIRLLFLVEKSNAASMTQDALWEMTRAIFGGDPELAYRNRAVYTVRQQVAESWRSGRCLILGDAAHAVFPVSGMAMNCGMHDAFELARALPDDAAITIWEKTRRESVHKRVAGHSNSTYKAINANGIFSRFARNRHLRGLKKHPEAERDHALRASMMEYKASPPPTIDPE